MARRQRFDKRPGSLTMRTGAGPEEVQMNLPFAGSIVVDPDRRLQRGGRGRNGGEREEADQAEYSGQIQEMVGHR
jgi:hypothetical protein